MFVFEGKSQIAEYYEHCRCSKDWKDSLTIRDVNEKFVQPDTTGTWRSVALEFNRERPKQVTVMISHCWAENAKDFFEDLETYLEDDEVAYICLLSNYQGTAEDIAKQLGDDIYQAPFTRVIQNRRCKRMLVVPNDEMLRRGEGLYSRLWCDWEIYYAARVGLPIHFTHRASYDYLFGDESPTTASSRNAHCSNPEDEAIIREAIESAAPRTRVIVVVQVLCVIYGAIFGITAALMRPEHGRLDLVVCGIAGLIVGGLLSSLWYICPATLSGGGADMYDLLDDVILAAANGSYAGARPRTRVWIFSVVVLFLLGSFLGVSLYTQGGEDDNNDGLPDLSHIYLQDGVFFMAIVLPLLGIVYMMPMAGMLKWVRTLKRLLVLSSGVSAAVCSGMTVLYFNKGKVQPCFFLYEAFVLGGVLGSLICYVILIPTARWKQLLMLLASMLFGLIGYSVDGVYTAVLLVPAGALVVYAAHFPEWELGHRALFLIANLAALALMLILHSYVDDLRPPRECTLISGEWDFDPRPLPYPR